MANAQFAAIILAGGQGSRMLYQDKGLLLFKNKPLVEYPIALLKKQVPHIIISANRHIDEYKTYNFPVVTDDANYVEMGPLGGIYSAAKYLPDTVEYVQIVPCDTPFLPDNLVEIMHAPFLTEDIDITVASAAGSTHPSIIQCKKNILPSLKNLLDDGSNLSLRAFIRQHRSHTVVFDREDYFINFNDPSILEQWNKE